MPFHSPSILHEHPCATSAAAADAPPRQQRAAGTATGCILHRAAASPLLRFFPRLAIKCYLWRMVARVPPPKGILPFCPTAPDGEFQQPAVYLHLPFVTSLETLRSEVQ